MSSSLGFRPTSSDPEFLRDCDLEKQFSDPYDDVRHIQDSVHGYIPIPQRIAPLLDTREFQRLRSLKQLGTSYYIFPGASHNRFEHCIGVMHLAGKMIDKLADKQPSLGITESEKYCVRVAGLLHDLGHGPFSHVFDHEVMREFIDREHRSKAAERRMSISEYLSRDDCARKRKFRHEDMSALLADSLFDSVKSRFLDTGRIYDISDEEIALIKAIITPSSFPEIVEQKRRIGRQWLFQIVANDTCGIDVDRWDYLRRDSDNCHVSVQFKYDRILEHCRVVGGDICYQDKVHFEVSLLFTARYELFKRVYSHKTSKAIEFQISDAMILSDHLFEISKKAESAEGYLSLDDHIIKQIANVNIPHPLPEDPSEKRNLLRLRKAKHLARRIEVRDLYRCVQYISLNADDVMLLIQRSKKRSMSFDDLLKESKLREKDAQSDASKTTIISDDHNGNNEKEEENDDDEHYPLKEKSDAHTPIRGRSVSELFGEESECVEDSSPKASKSVKIPYAEGMRLFEKDLFAILEGMQESSGVDTCRGGQQGCDGQLIECGCLEREYQLEKEAQSRIQELRELRQKELLSMMTTKTTSLKMSGTELQSTPPESRIIGGSSSSLSSSVSGSSSPPTEESSDSVDSVNREWKAKRKIHLKDLRVQLMSLHYGKESSHPIQDVRFFTASNPRVSFHAKPEQVSRMLEDACHREIILRVYTTERMWVSVVTEAVMRFHRCYDVVRVPKEQTDRGLKGTRPSTFSPMTSKGRRAFKRRTHGSGLSGDHQKKRRRTAGVRSYPSEGSSSDSSSGIAGTDSVMARLSFDESKKD